MAKEAIKLDVRGLAPVITDGKPDGVLLECNLEHPDGRVERNVHVRLSQAAWENLQNSAARWGLL